MKKIFKNNLKNLFVLSLVSFFVLIRIFFIFFSKSEIQTEYFFEFYSHFYINGDFDFSVYSKIIDFDKQLFPYPAMMVYINFIPYFIYNLMNFNNLYIFNVLSKFYLLIFEIMLLCYSVKFVSKNNYKKLTIYFVLSPVIIYVNYFYGHIDVISSAFLMLLLYKITLKDSKIISISILIAINILIKTHIILILPIIYIYTYSKTNISDLIKSLIYTTLFLLIFSIPFLSLEYLNSIIFSNETSFLTQFSLEINQVKVYVIPVVLIILYFIYYILMTRNIDLLFGFIIIIFTILNIFGSNNPNWFIWSMPLITILLTNINKSRIKPNLIYVIFAVLFLFYFVIFMDFSEIDVVVLNTSSSLINFENEFFQNLTFTTLIGTLIFLTIITARNAYESSRFYKKENIPFLVSISGDSGSGKSSLVKILSSLHALDDILHLEGDAEHKWERNDENWNNYTHLDPKANKLYKQLSYVQQLKKGISVFRSDYDHSTGKFQHPKKIKSASMIFLSGLHSLFLPSLRKESLLKIFLNTNNDIRINWKLNRDSQQRNKNRDDILNEIDLRTRDYFQYIEPQRSHCNLLIDYSKINKKGEIIECKYSFDSEIDIQKIIDYLTVNNILFIHSFNGLEDKQELIVVDEKITLNTINNILFYTSNRSDFPFKLKLNKEDFQINNITKILYVTLLDYYLRGKND
jgi:uridine kinase